MRQLLRESSSNEVIKAKTPRTEKSDLFGVGNVDVNVWGSIRALGPVDQSGEVSPIAGHALVVIGHENSITVGEDGLLESVNGHAFLSLDDFDGLPNEGAEDSFTLYGTVIGSMQFGAGEDMFRIGLGADISGITTADGGADYDTLSFAEWSGTTDLRQFTNFEALEITGGSELVLTGPGVGFSSISLIGSIVAEFKS